MHLNNYTSMPADYPVCMHNTCQLAATCLRQIAYAEKLDSEQYLNLINPRLCTQDSSCPYFRDSQPIVFARGFKGMQAKMYPNQYQQFMNKLIMEWTRNSYFASRRGDRLLSPCEQELVRSVLREVGVQEDLAFDAYESHVDYAY